MIKTIISSNKVKRRKINNKLIYKTSKHKIKTKLINNNNKINNSQTKIFKTANTTLIVSITMIIFLTTGVGEETE